MIEIIRISFGLLIFVAFIAVIGFIIWFIFLNFRLNKLSRMFESISNDGLESLLGYKIPDNELTTFRNSTIIRSSELTFTINGSEYSIGNFYPIFKESIIAHSKLHGTKKKGACIIADDTEKGYYFIQDESTKVWHWSARSQKSILISNSLTEFMSLEFKKYDPNSD
jgi:hypothetical protein